LLYDYRFIATTGRRNRGIDSEHAKLKGISVSGTDSYVVPGSNSGSTLEHIWALILSSARHIVQEDRNIKSCCPQWQTIVPASLAGKTLGLIGLGTLGTQVAEVR